MFTYRQVQMQIWGHHGHDLMVLDLQLPMQSMPFTTNVVSLNLYTTLYD